MKRLYAFLFIVFSILASTQAFAVLGASGTMTPSGGPSTYHYSISITNTGDSTVGIFWFGWVPGENFMSVAPTNVTAPTGWTVDYVSHGGAADGYGIHFTCTNGFAPGATASGFEFDSTMTPAEMAGDSSYYPGTKVGTSYVFAPLAYGGAVFTVTVQIPVAVSSLALDQGAVVGGNNATGTATLSAAAGTGGFAVSLSSSNTAVATVPASVTVSQGATTAPITVATKGVDAATNVTITASGGGGTKTAILGVQPASLASVNPAASVKGGLTGSGTVTLNGAAGASGKSGTMASDNAGVKVPATINVSAQGTSVPFSFTTPVVNADTIVHISATVNGITKTGTTTILTAALKSAIVSSHIYGGMNGSLLLYLDGKAGTNGKTINVSSSNTNAATVGPTGTIGAGHGSGSAIIKTSAVGSSTSITFTATLGSVSKQATTSILPATLGSLLATPTTIVGGDSASGTVALLGSTLAGYSVSLTSSDSATASVPASGNVPAGSKAVAFTITTHTVTANHSVTLTATHGALVRTITITVVPVPVASAVQFGASSVKGGTAVTCTVTLSGPAPKAGATVSLQSDSAHAPVPASVSVPAGATSVQFTITTTAVTVNTTAHISATLHSVAAQGTLTITP